MSCLYGHGHLRNFAAGLPSGRYTGLGAIEASFTDAAFGAPEGTGIHIVGAKAIFLT